MLPIRLAAFLLTVAIPSQVVAQAAPPPAKKAVSSLADLPRFAYPVSGDVARFIDQPAELAPLTARLKADVTATLLSYDIQDRATLGQLHTILRNIALYENDAVAFERENQIVRSFQDKPALATWLGIPDTARLAAAKASSPGTPAFTDAFKRDLRVRLSTLDWAVTGQTVKERYRGLALTGAGLQRGALTEGIQPTVDASGSLDMNGLAGLIAVVNNVRNLIPLVDAEREVEGAWIAANEKQKPDIWKARAVVLSRSERLSPVVIGIWDTGADTGPFASTLWTNAKEKPNGRDDDENGWVDDVHGVAIDVMAERTPSLLVPLPTEFKSDLPRLALASKGIADVEAGLDTVEAKEVALLFRTISADDAKKLFAGLGWYGSYAHGTHVAGIAMEGNPAARLLVARTSFDWRSPPRRPTEATARAFAQRHQDIVEYFKSHAVRVVNMSWTVGLKDEYENQLIANGVAPERAAIEGKRLFQIERAGLYQAMSAAPDILFVVAAGNSNDNADFSGNAPSSFNLPNVITVAALDQAGEPTNFTTSGSTVALAASGYQVASVVPGGQVVRWSGTSMASPQVTNAAAKLFALNPKLSASQVREILSSTATPGPGGFKQLNTRSAVARVRPSMRMQ